MNAATVEVENDAITRPDSINTAPKTTKSPKTVDELNVLFGEPILINVVDPGDPLEPILTVFVFPVVVAPYPRLIVEFPVALPRFCVAPSNVRVDVTVNEVVITADPATRKSPPTATPPVTTNAPVLTEVAWVAFVICIALLDALPLEVIVCSVELFQIVIVPVAAETEVSVPAVSVCTPRLVKTTEPVDVLTPI